LRGSLALGSFAHADRIAFGTIGFRPDLRSCPFRADEKPVLSAGGWIRVEAVAAICPKCGALGPMATGDDPPGHAERLWNSRFGSDH
jgi:hypothetical protein